MLRVVLQAILNHARPACHAAAAVCVGCAGVVAAQTDRDRDSAAYMVLPSVPAPVSPVVRQALNDCVYDLHPSHTAGLLELGPAQHCL